VQVIGGVFAILAIKTFVLKICAKKQMAPRKIRQNVRVVLLTVSRANTVIPPKANVHQSIYAIPLRIRLLPNVGVVRVKKRVSRVSIVIPD